MRILLIPLILSLITYAIIFLKGKKISYIYISDNIRNKFENILLYFNIFEVQYPQSYINNEKLLGLHVRDIEKDAYRVYPILKELKQKDYFRVFKVNLHLSCKAFLKGNEKCKEIKKCSVCECEQDEIPYNFRTNEIEIIENKMTNEDLKKTFIESKLYKDILGIYAPSNEGFISYVDLVYNSPSFTAYEGRNIWNMIYKENCFQNEKSECEEMNSFYKIISGMQSNIAVLSSEYFYLKNDFVFGEIQMNNKFNNDYLKNLNYDYSVTFFKEKIGLYPERIENLYFTFAILLRSMCRLKSLFKQCKCNSGYEQNDKEAVRLLDDLLENFYHSCSSKEFLEPLFPQHGKDILSKFMNITNILDCVPCVKCRLHGKLKTTALQIALVEGVSDEHIGSLERNEITALINALYYFADSILIINKFEDRLKLKKTIFIFYVLSFSLFLFLVIYSIVFLTIRNYKKKKKKVA
ncbi:putative endoplasmic reticulum oxidoreductin [Plasmodium gaboni]|uniref:Endoplasmic reticulum oxidoreductin, putative n=1 Tax=Plasmodium gaboni TaxID=647221 RepID=A0A151LIW7_9APIC|nr:putative endoplasmic reticulum oxidoreductin [Plasmodium gaboni]KYN98882.1 putative endoplasmic reticulum oxidoreductin [Plasmodium gaboni]SOV15674.1 endoplasmic reticulum oxidoreductin, putative [Plasmodium gaboni]SOV23317.1 endoplasmic reticulum oxidoreductin, putative [Plasmodium sp. DRC-Itaito]